jgi:choloylglycine hydrolase
MISGRTFDWERHLNDVLWIMPRGMKRQGRAGANSASWTSKYGSLIVASANGASDGLSQAGLAAHLLYLDTGIYEVRDGRPGVATIDWVQYLLDNFQTVGEALDHLKNVQIVSVPISGYDKGLRLHLAMEDVRGDSAVVEFIKGRMVVHFGKQYQIMRNEPAYDEQLANLRHYLPFKPGAELPGNTSPADRFVRAAYFLHYLPKPKDAEEAAAYMMSLDYNVSVPFGAPYVGLSATYPTWWRDVVDLTNRRIYFNYALSPNVIWINLSTLNFQRDQPAKRLNALDPGLVGDVSNSFVPAAAPF